MSGSSKAKSRDVEDIQNIRLGLLIGPLVQTPHGRLVWFQMCQASQLPAVSQSPSYFFPLISPQRSGLPGTHDALTVDGQ
jgi:hypothetical protein